MILMPTVKRSALFICTSRLRIKVLPMIDDAVETPNQRLAVRLWSIRWIIPGVFCWNAFGMRSGWAPYAPSLH